MNSNSASFSPAADAAIEPASQTASTDTPTRSRGRRPLLVILAVLVLLAAGTYGWHRLQYALAHVDTDDAQVEGDISPVLPRVSGYVTQVLVHDNEHVAAGQPLLEVDSRELDLKVTTAATAVSSADAALATARATVLKAQASLAVARSSMAVSAVRLQKAESDLKRDTALFQNGAITDRQLSDTRAAADVARTENDAAARQAEAAASEVEVARAEEAAAATAVRSRQADLDYAKLQRSYATVTAPIAGVVSRKSVEPGQFVQTGQTLLSVAADTGVWVVANFKETQMEHVRAGQPVDITVDSYPGITFAGRVDSVAGATGARFALLPPDNASGNFIKVTQRLPVKILLVDPPADHPLRAGMSVDAAIKVGS